MKTKCILAAVFLFLAASQVFSLADEIRQELNKRYEEISLQMKMLYDKGSLRQVIELYKKKCCQTCQFKEKWKVGREKKEFKKVKDKIRAEIYKYLTLSFIALHRPDQGEVYLRRLLVLLRDEGTDKYWNYIRKSAPGNFIVVPRLSVGFKIGGNFTFIYPTGRYMVLYPTNKNLMDFYRKNYVFDWTDSHAMHVGTIIEYALTRSLSLSFQPTFTWMRFKYMNRFERDAGDRESSDQKGSGSLTYVHRHELDYVEIPLLLKYCRANDRRWKPYIQAGGYVRLRESATKNVEAYNMPDRTYKDEAVIDIQELICGTAYGLWLGAGMNYHLQTPDIFLALEINYRYGLKNITNRYNRYNSEQLKFAYYDIFDDMRTGNLEISLKVMVPISYKAFKK
jgi:hypothetical protein